MKEIRNHKDLDVWKLAVDFTTDIYQATRPFPKSEMYGLTSQLRRAAVSIASNIAEGASWQSPKEFVQFLHMALGSSNEIETQLLVSRNLDFLTDETVHSLLHTQERLSMMISGLIRSLIMTESIRSSADHESRVTNHVTRLIACLLTTAAILFASCARQTSPSLHTGDLVFQDLNCGVLCDAIESVTEAQFHVKGPALSHVGLVIRDGDNLSLLEAYDGAVRLSPLKEVLARGQNSPPRIIRASALKDLPSDFGERLKGMSPEYLGKPYDDFFTWDEESYYCSELVASIFRHVVGQDYFATAPMTFGERGSKARAVWEKYFAERGVPIPEGKPGISPLGLWLQAHNRILQKQ